MIAYLYAQRMNVDLRQLRALVAVLEEGTFTDAAIALDTSQASVSRAVADLERSLGRRLVQRTSRGALPTPIGRQVADRGRRALAEIAGIEQLSREDLPTELRIGFAWAVFGPRTTTVQRRWQAANPDGTLTFLQSNSPTAGLVEGLVDIAVIRRPLDDRRFEISPVGLENRVVAVSADDPLSRRRRLQLADLVDRPIALDPASGSTSTDLWPAAARPSTVKEVHGIEEWLTAIGAGLAIGMTSEATADQFPRRGVRYRPVLDAPPIAVWLVWWRDDPPAGAGALRQLVAEIYAEG